MLSRHRRNFDPTTTLLSGDVVHTQITIGTDIKDCIRVHLKSPKEEKLSMGVYIDLFPVSGLAAWMCPVKAYTKWSGEKSTRSRSHLPMFTEVSGELYTGQEFNKDLKRLLPKSSLDKEGKITSHSFRAGQFLSYLSTAYIYLEGYFPIIQYFCFKAVFFSS